MRPPETGGAAEDGATTAASTNLDAADRLPLTATAPGARHAVGREQALHVLTELHDVQSRPDDLKRRLRELAKET